MIIERKGNKLVKISENNGMFMAVYCQECRTGIADEIETDLLDSWSADNLLSCKKWAAHKLLAAA